MKISVCIPIHNEEDNLRQLYAELVAALEPEGTDFEIIMVNDGSEDQSGQLIDRIAAADNRVRAIHLVRNYGQTSAMMAGFDHAAGDIIVAMDGDNQNDPRDIPQLVAKINAGYDVVSGWPAACCRMSLFPEEGKAGSSSCSALTGFSFWCGRGPRI